MDLQSDIIIYFLKNYVTFLLAYYSFIKITNTQKCSKKVLILTCVFNVLLGAICTYIKFYVNSSISVITLCICNGIVWGLLTKNKVGYSIFTTVIAYAVSIVSLGFSIILEYLPYRLLEIKNNYLNLVIILIIQLGIIQTLFNFKRFKNGFNFFNKKLNNELADIILINISIIILLIYCLTGAHYDEITWNLLITLIFLCFTMFIIIQKTLTMHYKQKLLNDTLQHYEQEIQSKDAELEKLKAEKFKISKTTHEFYNRQKALELLVKSNINNTKNNVEEKASPNVLNIIKSLTEEYSNELTNFKELPKLETTEIPEIDNMFKYMQSECAKNNIEFKLKVIGNIFPLINNIINKNKLETLIGDHLRDAINAIKASNTDKKEILAILGIKDNKYELSIYDTGIDFTIDTLLKLGLEAVTTNKENGGSGIGFLTTFETMNQTKASLIITEFPQNKDRYYTKSVTIRFDGENKYKICSHRAEEIEEHNDDKRIIVEKI